MFWKRYENRVKVFEYQDGKQVQVPRALTSHLDNEPDHNIDHFVRQLEIQKGIERTRKETVRDENILKLVDDFIAHLSNEGRSKDTLRSHRFNLVTHALPYFVNEAALAEPQQWTLKSIRLRDYLQGKGCQPRTVNVVTISIRKFWKYLAEEGLVEGELRLRNAIDRRKETPLSFTITPKDLLAFRYKSEDARLIALLGYGFSLRPQEIVALRPMDFRAGDLVEQLECSKVMKAAGLFNRLLVNVSRQRAGNEFKTPKSGSKGWVACFDEGIAKEIVRLLSSRDPKELIFSYRLDWYFRLWRRDGFKGLSIKDLRRASIYYLGHYAKLEFSALKNHARHSDPSTTALYIRRPEEVLDGDFKLVL